MCWRPSRRCEEGPRAGRPVEPTSYAPPLSGACPTRAADQVLEESPPEGAAPETHELSTDDAGVDAEARAKQAAAGLTFGILAYLAWGLSPLYWKPVLAASPYEVLAHRIVWAVPLLALVLFRGDGWSTVGAAIRSRRIFGTLMLTSLLIAANWFIYIWANHTDRILHASLGYYINPLVSVAFGMVFLKERVNRWQGASILIGAAGVLYMTLGVGEFPWISILLAFSFGSYALLRKSTPVGALPGLFIESTLLLPFAAAYLVYLGVESRLSFGGESNTLTFLLLLAGAVTLLPLLWFTGAARRLSLTSLSIIQYLGPTGQFLLAVLLYDESFTTRHGIAFACIWTAVILYTWDSIRRARKMRRERRERIAGARV